MSRLLLLAILVLWMSSRDNASIPAWDVPTRLGLFFGIYALLVAGMSLWSRLLARRVGDDFLGRSLDRYNKAHDLARYFVPVWFAVGLFCLRWDLVAIEWVWGLEPGITVATERAARATSAATAVAPETYWKLPALLLGTLPALLAWMGLWWAQYPADRALKEQSVLYHANEGLPVHAPPGFGTFFVEHFRQQLMFTLAPILLIIAAKDVLAAGFLLNGRPDVIFRGAGELLFVPLSLAVFVVAPELMRRIIPTTPLPANWPLRRRLDAMCARAGLKYRDILVWQTNSSMGNAMVMGLFPQVRYVFLSDLLLETMKDDEIEAVFAHELGHVVHRHMWWYLLFMAALLMFAEGPFMTLVRLVPGMEVTAAMTAPQRMEVWAWRDQISVVFTFVTFVLMFGFLSRRFERQADVYAARTMQATHHERGTVTISHVNPEAAAIAAGASAGALFIVPNLAGAGPGGGTVSVNPPAPDAPTMISASPTASHVGEYGATVVASALHRVARVNNIPLAAHEWLHGSIASRMRYLKGIATDPSATRRFDKYMRRLYWSLLAVLASLAAWLGTQSFLRGF
jgi:STE24 endopeptidase